MIKIEDKNYSIRERVQEDIKKYGSAHETMKQLKKELEEMESLWNKYSSDCLGHGITCTRLKISWLELILKGLF